MATYNGATFIGEQLASIIPQLMQADEIVIVDDGSTDSTLAAIDGALGDAPVAVQLLQNHINQGHVSTFDRAIRAASNEVLVLADQDDVWLPGYLETVRAAFDGNPTVGLTVARPVFCDAGLEPIAHKNARYRHPSSTGLLGVAAFLLNRAMPIGCTMSIRKTDLAYVLPFPEKLLAHDHWLFAMATLRRRMLPLADDAVLYRRHDGVVTHKRRPLQMVTTRVRFIGQLLRRLLRADTGR